MNELTRAKIVAALQQENALVVLDRMDQVETHFNEKQVFRDGGLIRTREFDAATSGYEAGKDINLNRPLEQGRSEITPRLS